MKIDLRRVGQGVGGVILMAPFVTVAALAVSIPLVRLLLFVIFGPTIICIMMAWGAHLLVKALR